MMFRCICWRERAVSVLIPAYNLVIVHADRHLANGLGITPVAICPQRAASECYSTENHIIHFKEMNVAVVAIEFPQELYIFTPYTKVILMVSGDDDNILKLPTDSIDK